MHNLNYPQKTFIIRLTRVWIPLEVVCRLSRLFVPCKNTAIFLGSILVGSFIFVLREVSLAPPLVPFGCQRR